LIEEVKGFVPIGTAIDGGADCHTVHQSLQHLEVIVTIFHHQQQFVRFGLHTDITEKETETGE
jgi:hypothetical protein